MFWASNVVRVPPETPREKSGGVGMIRPSQAMKRLLQMLPERSGKLFFIPVHSQDVALLCVPNIRPDSGLLKHWTLLSECLHELLTVTLDLALAVNYRQFRTSE